MACTENLVPSGAIPKKSIEKPNISSPSENYLPGQPWQQRLFGKQLLDCGDCHQKLVDVNNALVGDANAPVSGVIGVYFSFINTGATCDDFTRQLAGLYDTINTNGALNGEGGDGVVKKFEVVHVVLWSNVADVVDFEESFSQHVADLPWLAVPNRDYERKVRKF